MTNIASNETQSFDLTGSWLTASTCDLTFRFTDDDAEDLKIHYNFDRYDLEFLRDVIQEFLDSQPGS